MKLHLDVAPRQNFFTAYGDGYVAVNQERYEESLVVTPERVIRDWRPGSVDGLRLEHFAFVEALAPEIVILGTGRTLRFPPRELLHSLAAAHVGVEVMDTHAACRTYNILSGEGRKVAAALLIEK
jgi:uncharacterized protein